MLVSQMHSFCGLVPDGDGPIEIMEDFISKIEHINWMTFWHPQYCYPVWAQNPKTLFSNLIYPKVCDFQFHCMLMILFLKTTSKKNMRISCRISRTITAQPVGTAHPW